MAKVASISSRPLKLDDSIEDRDDVMSAFMTPEVEETNYILIRAMSAFCLLCNRCLDDFVG